MADVACPERSGDHGRGAAHGSGEGGGHLADGVRLADMTGAPEAALARELALCYTTIALVTDLDAGVDGDHGVTQEEVFRVFKDNTERMRTLLLAAITNLPRERDCPCPAALDGMSLPFELP